VSLLSDAAAALLERGDIQGADRILTSALDPGFEDPPAEIRVRVEQQLIELQRSTADTATAKQLADEAIAILEQRADQRGLSRAWRLAAFAAWVGGLAGDAGTAWERAAHHAHADGNELERANLLSWVPSCLWVGPTPVEEAIARTEEIRAVVKMRRASGAEVLRCLAALHGFAGRFDLARALFAESTAIFTELGLGLRSVPSHQEAKVAMIAGDYGHAEECLRTSYDALETMGERSIRSTTAALLAHVNVAQDRMEEAEKFAGIAQDLAPSDDVLTHILSESAYGRILSSRGLHEAAELHARSAVALAAATDFVSFHADALVDLADVLESAGSGAASSSVRAEAFRLYERKGNIVGTRRARAALDVRASA
jgi:tetratricopeptide (TPR) repeat protein